MSVYFWQDNKKREQARIYFCDLPVGWERKKNVAFLGKYFKLQSLGPSDLVTVLAGAFSLSLLTV